MSLCQLVLIDEDEEVQELTDCAYWEARRSKAAVAMIDEILKLVMEFAPGLELEYNKFTSDLSPMKFLTMLSSSGLRNLPCEWKYACRHLWKQRSCLIL